RRSSLANAFGDRIAVGGELSCLDPGIDGSAERVSRGRDNLGIAKFQRHSHAGQSAAGADRTDETIDASARLTPDFRARSLNMGFAIGGVVELIGPDRAARFGIRQLLGQALRN